MAPFIDFINHDSRDEAPGAPPAASSAGCPPRLSAGRTPRLSAGCSACDVGSGRRWARQLPALGAARNSHHGMRQRHRWNCTQAACAWMET
eukprot:365535-Chlamydomonas_euryale.AAC.23